MRAGLCASAFLAALALTRPALADGTSSAQEDTLTIDSAHKLYADAVQDEDDQHLYDVALTKFRRVQSFRDSANVRYRIASCLDGLGQGAAALSGYQAAIDLAGTDPASTEVVTQSRARMSALDAKVAKVTLVLSDRAPADAEVSIDDVALARAAMQAPIVLDPGHHTFAATAKGAAPFHASMTLAEGARLSLTIALDPAPAPPITPRIAPPVKPPPPPEHVVAPRDSAEPAPSHTLPYVAIAGGATLVFGSVVVLLLRQSAISDLNSSCPAGMCPSSREGDLSSERSRALFEGPLAAAMAGLGAAAAGVGLYFALKHDAPARADGASAATTLRIAPMVSRSGAMLGAFADW